MKAIEQSCFMPGQEQLQCQTKLLRILAEMIANLPRKGARYRQRYTSGSGDAVGAEPRGGAVFAEPDGGTVGPVCEGQAGTGGGFGAALYSPIGELVVERPILSYMDVAAASMYEGLVRMVVPGI